MSDHTTISNDGYSPQRPLTEADIPRLQELLRNFEELGSDIEQTRLDLRPYLDRMLHELAGSHLETMLCGQKETIEYLDNPDPRLRRAALWLAHGHWQITTLLATKYENMAALDPACEVRAEAIVALGNCHALTRDTRIGHFLAGIVRDGNLPSELRLSAFHALVCVHGLTNYPNRSIGCAQSVEEVDWELVAEYLGAKKD
jgi:hypothetical protein